MIKRKIEVYSEIGSLKTVLLHRPGHEVENLIPEYLERLLFDDIPYLKVAREEHDIFAKVLTSHGVEVLYLENLISETLENVNARYEFIDDLILRSSIPDKSLIDPLKKWLLSMTPKDMIDTIIAGVRKKDIGLKESFDEYTFILDPMPNLYFTRDPFTCLGKGIALSSMKKIIRRRESIFGQYIFKYHPSFKDSNIPIYYDSQNPLNIEGGDQLVLSKDVLAMGYSERTDKNGIISAAKNIFKSGDTFKKVLIFDLPKIRAFMHLDTVFTMIDYDKFIVHPLIENMLNIVELTYDSKTDDIIIKNHNDSAQAILSKAIGVDVNLIKCGNGDNIAAGREQWNDGSNALAISAGNIITYERNYVTNEILDKLNIKVNAIPSSELSRGRGGPRCMSMPFVRESIKSI